MNLQEIYNAFFINDDPGFPKLEEDGTHFISFVDNTKKKEEE